MSYVTPNSVIQYFSGIGLSPNYENCAYFASTSARDSAFAALPKVAQELNCSYVSKDGTFFRSSLPISTLVNVNYIRFQNTSFENQWFYAFVTSVDYANNGMTEVHFTLDIMTTYMGLFTLGQCFVAREHVANDAKYLHTLVEDLPTGDYRNAYVEDLNFFQNAIPKILVSYSMSKAASAEHETASATRYNGWMVAGGVYKGYSLDASGVTELEDDLQEYIDDNKADAIISLMVVPAAMIPEAVTDTMHGLVPKLAQAAAEPTTLDGYTPINNKLFAYPYALLEVNNNEGSAAEYRYDMFTTYQNGAEQVTPPKFAWYGTAFGVAEAACYPIRYKHKTGDTLNTPTFEDGLYQRQFPQASFSVDAYKAWLAQMTSGGGFTQVVGSVAASVGAGALLSVITGNPLGILSSVASGAESVGKFIGEMRDYKSLPDTIHGAANTQLMHSIRCGKPFTAYHKTITAEYAKMIDEYFSMYGYKVNTVKTPSMHNRANWTFVQTNGCVVKGNIPATIARDIENIFNKGCRFWTSITNIGNYGNFSNATL